jgi:hypothetical protein
MPHERSESAKQAFYLCITRPHDAWHGSNSTTATATSIFAIVDFRGSSRRCGAGRCSSSRSKTSSPAACPTSSAHQGGGSGCRIDTGQQSQRLRIEEYCGCSTAAAASMRQYYQAARCTRAARLNSTPGAAANIAAAAVQAKCCCHGGTSKGTEGVLWQALRVSHQVQENPPARIVRTLMHINQPQ